MKYGRGKFGQHSYGESPSVELYGDEAKNTNQYIIARKYRDLNKRTDRAFLTALRLNVIQENIVKAIAQAESDGFDVPDFTPTQYDDGDLQLTETALNELYEIVRSLWNNYSYLDQRIKLVGTNKPNFEDINEIEKSLWYIIKKGE